jgi:lysophospholipase L1-like esterase
MQGVRAPATAPRTPVWTRRLAVSLGVLAGLGLALELGWRVFLAHFATPDQVHHWVRPEDMAAERWRYRPHPYLGYALNPAFRSEDGRDRHNALGFRGRDFAREKPPGVYRIVCIGGSTTYDNKVADWREAYPAQLETVLRTRYGRPEVEVVNAGVPGYNSWESLANLQFRVLELEPDLVVVYHATNDVHARLVPPELYRGDNSGHRTVWREERHWWDRSAFLHFVGVLLRVSQDNSVGDHAKVRHPDAIETEATLDANPPRYFRANLESMVAIARQHGFALLLPSWASCPHKGDYASTPLYRRGFAEHNAVLREVAEENGVPFYDFAAEMTCDPALWDDGRHNTAAGARLKAELFAAFLDAHVLPVNGG